MIDLLNENVISLTEAANTSPLRPHVSTVFRWIQRGVCGIKLESAMLGGRRVTSREAIQRFSDRVSAARRSGGDDSPPKRRTERQKQAAIERAERELAEAGV